MAIPLLVSAPSCSACWPSATARCPPLGPALDPGRGVWTSASGAALPHAQALPLPGLDHPVQVSFTSHGVPSVRAAGQHDLFLALGYLHARFRLTQMDLERRLGEGRLAQLAGPSALGSDKFELRLGLLRTAQQEWAQMPRSSPAAQALLAYSRGVNDYLAQLRRDRPVAGPVLAGRGVPGRLDAGGQPGRPGRSDPGAGLHHHAAGLRAAGADPGRGPDHGLVPDPAAEPAAPLRPRPVPQGRPRPAPGRTVRLSRSRNDNRPAYARSRAPPVPRRGRAPAAAHPAAEATAAAALLAAGERAARRASCHSYPDSNAWAANGPAVAGGRSMLAGDPHLPQTIPSVWYQVALSAPGYAVSGVSVPGLPGVLLGHNQHIAWSLTDTQNQATLFYTEQTSKTRPGQYFWDGAWRRMRQVHYTIAVRGAAAQRLTVDLTVHGPIMTQAGQTTSVDWMGNVPSPDLAVLLARQPGAATGPSSTRRWRTGARPRRTSCTPTTGATSARSRPGTTRWSGTASPGCRCPAPAPTTWPG